MVGERLGGLDEWVGYNEEWHWSVVGWRVWDAATGELTASWQGHTWWVSGAAFLPDPLAGAGAPAQQQRNFLTISADKSASLWTTSGDRLWRLSPSAAPLTVAAFSGDGSRLAIGSDAADGRAWLYALPLDSEPELLAELGGHRGSRVNGVAFGAGGRWLATTGDDGHARVYEAATGEEVADLDHGVGARVTGAAFSPVAEEKQLVATVASGADRALRYWDAATGEPAGHFPVERGLTAVAWSAGGGAAGLGKVAAGDERGALFVVERRR